MAEETKDPIKVYPKALFRGLTAAAIIYFLVAFTASMVVETGQLAGSDAPLLEVVEVSDFPIPLEVFSLVALIAITNTALLNMVMASRLTYGMARQGIIPSVLSRVHEGRRTPLVAIVLTTLLAFALIITGDLEVLAATTVALLLGTFAMVNISCLVARQRSPVDHDHFNAPTIFPVLGAIACLVLLTQQDAAVYQRAGILLFIGLVLWVVNRIVTGHARSPQEADADPEPIRASCRLSKAAHRALERTPTIFTRPARAGSLDLNLPVPGAVLEAYRSNGVL